MGPKSRQLAEPFHIVKLGLQAAGFISPAASSPFRMQDIQYHDSSGYVNRRQLQILQYKKT